MTVTLAPNATTAPADINNGSYDPDFDPITLSQTPPGPYSVGQTLVTLTVGDGLATDSCQGTVTVRYLFDWFNFSDLLLSEQALNQVTAGSTVPIRFTLYGNKGNPSVRLRPRSRSTVRQECRSAATVINRAYLIRLTRRCLIFIKRRGGRKHPGRLPAGG